MSDDSMDADISVSEDEEDTVKVDTQTFQVVLKGGSPWGFKLRGGRGLHSPIQISQIESGSKAMEGGHLREGDYVLSINSVSPQHLAEAEQLIKDAFRTLTLTVWRGTSKLESSVKILRSSSFLQRAREVQERERQRVGLQDDTIVSSDGVTMKPRQRRVESFHGSRKGRHSSSSSLIKTSSQDSPLRTKSHHLSSSSLRDYPTPSPGNQTTSQCPRSETGPSNTSSNRSTIYQSSQRSSDIFSNRRRHSSSNSSSSSRSCNGKHHEETAGATNKMSKDKLKGWSTIQDLSQKERLSQNDEPPNCDHGNTNVNQPNSPQTGHLSPAMSSPSLNMAEQFLKKPPSPRLELNPTKSSPDLMDSQPLSPRSPSSPHAIPPSRYFPYPQGYKKMAWTGYVSPEDSVLKDTRQTFSNKPFKSNLHDYQNISEFTNQGVDETDIELQKLTSRTREPYDPRPPCSPPAPPVRDVSSLQYGNKPQSHEKYPSWPVTQPSIETESGEPITSPKSKASYHPQLNPVNERNSPNAERKSGDDYKRNASDPGFKKQIPFSRFMKRPTPNDHIQLSINMESRKNAESQMEEFFSSSPGYPQPMLDQDGNRIGDEKYNIPSPPERESCVPDEKTLSEKIASIVGPHHDYQGSSGYGSDYRGRDSSATGSPYQDNKKRDSHSHISPGKSPVLRGLVDTGTNPVDSESKSLISSSSMSYEPPRTYVVKQMVCYNTGTQTDEKEVKSDKYLQEKSIQARLSSSDSDSAYKEKSDGSKRDLYKSDRRYSGNDQNSGVNRYNGGEQIKTSSATRLSGSDQIQTSSANRYSGNDQIHISSANRYSGSDQVQTSSANRYSGSEQIEILSDIKGKDISYPDDYPPNMAPMLRKLTREYYGGKLHASASEKRLSSASSQDSSLRSPGSEIPNLGHYPGMKEAESYSSVVIHPNENSSPFGRDYAESRSSIGDSRHDVSGNESDRNSVLSSESKSRTKRHGLDPSMYSPKFPLFNPASRVDPRYNSDANLQMFSSARDHSRSLISVSDKHTRASSMLEEVYYRNSHPSNDSSPSQPQSTSDSRSSVSTHYSSDSSPMVQGQQKSRRESTDSVFIESPSQSQPSSSSDSPGALRPKDFNIQNRPMGRSASMKKAYGIYDEHERLPSHKRQESDITSNSSSQGTGIVHARSHSEYMRMDHYQRTQSENKHLTLIREDSSENRSQEVRWEEAVRKSKSLTQNSTNSPFMKMDSNYENMKTGKDRNTENFLDVSQSSNSLSSNLKRTSSEQIRPKKDRLRDKNSGKYESDKSAQISPNLHDKIRSPSQSQMDLRQTELKSNVQLNPQRLDSSMVHDNGHNVVQRQRSASDTISIEGENSLSKTEKRHASDSDTNNECAMSPTKSEMKQETNLKDVQRIAVQKYMDRVQGKKNETESNKEESPSSPTLTATESFRRKYANRAERQESLRRSRSVSSRDSDYMEMKRPERHHPPTEWSRIRSQTGGSRPHSIGSDSSLVDPYAVTSVSGGFPESEIHQRSQSDSANTASSQLSELQAVPVKDIPQSVDDQSSGGISKNSLYQNVGYRPPPPVPPMAADEDQPPALPPRNYKRFFNSQSDSSLLPLNPIPQQPVRERNSIDHGSKFRMETRKWEDDNYAEQLRKQSRRLSEQQHMPPPMSYKTTKTSIQFTQSYKQQHVEALEATTPNSSSSDHVFHPRLMSSGQPPSPSSGSLSSPLSSPKFSNSPKPHSPKEEGQSKNRLDSHNDVKPYHMLENRDAMSRVDFSVRPDHQIDNKSYHVQENRDSKPHIDISVSNSWKHPSQISPDPPPPPTPQKDLPLSDIDLPPPPPELVDNSSEDIKQEEENGYADDSYGSYKSKTDRQPGVYKRCASSGDALKILHENNNYKPQLEKPPRTRLKPAWKSEQAVNLCEQIPEQAPSVPSFRASESVSSKLERSMPRPLVSSQSSGHLFAPKPYTPPDSGRSNSFSENFSNQNWDKNSSENKERQSVQERISSIERNHSFSKERSDLKLNTSHGHTRKSYENFSKSFTVSPGASTSRQSYEKGQIQTENKLNSSISESVHYKSHDSFSHNSAGVASPRRTSYPSDPSPGNLAVHKDNGPPPVDRSPGSGYPGSIHREERVKNLDLPGHSAKMESNSLSNTKSSFSDRKWQSFSQIPTSSPENKLNSSVSNSVTPDTGGSHARQRSQEELECDAKVQEFAKIYEEKDPKLSNVLKTDNKGRMQYMNGLFPVEVSQQDIQRRSPRSTPKTSPKSSCVSENQDSIHTPAKEEQTTQESEEKSPLPSNYWVSPSKAVIEMSIRESEEMGRDMTKDIDDSDKLVKTKEELVDSIQRKMDKLKEEKDDLTKELEEINSLGKQVEKVVDEKCRSQHEKDKFRSYIVDMEKIILLLLKLSGLLARAENALQSLPEDVNERIKKMASDKRDRVKLQHEEAKILKEDIDKRSQQVASFLQEVLSETEYEDYKYFVKMKSKLTIEKQELEDKVALGDEQIAALKQSIPGEI